MTLPRVDSPQYALDRLGPNRITFVRELRGLTKKQLAQSIKKTSSAISQIERGLIRPDLETFVSISFALKIPPSFFIEKPFSEKPIDLASCHFRSLRSTSQAMRRQSTRKGELWLDLMEIIESKGVIFPEEHVSNFNIPTGNEKEIEQVASEVRGHWGLGLGPIPNIVQLVESQGIMVLLLPDVCHKVDAYSTWRGKRPCMLLSYKKTPSRVRFDISHELGHLVMHEDTASGDAKSEREANRFAGAFLAPRESFLEECPRRWSFEAFRRLKARWKMSIQALLYRARDLGCISTSTQRRAMVQLTLDGKRKNEGDEWPMEKPVLLTQAIELLHDQITLSELAEELSIYTGELKEMLSQCVPVETLNMIDRHNETNSGSIVKLREQ